MKLGPEVVKCEIYCFGTCSVEATALSLYTHIVLVRTSYVSDTRQQHVMCVSVCGGGGVRDERVLLLLQ